MELSPDAIVYGHLGPLAVSATLVYTWGVMALLTIGAWLVTRRLSAGERLSRWQNRLEVLVEGTAGQIEEIVQQPASEYLPFLGTLFLFIVTCNVLSVVPGFRPPTGSLSTTAALAIVVFVAAPVWGIRTIGFRAYVRNYVEPSVVALPFNIIGEISRTVALAVRLFGNVMSGTFIAALLLAIAPIVFPVALQLLGLITGVIQAYIFAILAAVYIGAATRAHEAQPAVGSPADGKAGPQ